MADPAPLVAALADAIEANVVYIKLGSSATDGRPSEHLTSQKWIGPADRIVAAFLADPRTAEALAVAVAKWLWEDDWDQVQDGLEGCREHAAVIIAALGEEAER
jgi:hypothetical protein